MTDQIAGITVWCYDKCHSICQFAASRNDGYTSCRCRCHGYCCESLRGVGTCSCPGREQVVGR